MIKLGSISKCHFLESTNVRNLHHWNICNTEFFRHPNREHSDEYEDKRASLPQIF